MLNQETAVVVTESNNTFELDMTFEKAEPIVRQFSSDFNDEDTANEARALSGYHALSAYVKNAYGSPEHEPVEQGIRDMLGDLQHLCHKLDLDFLELLCRAQATFEDELLHPLG